VASELIKEEGANNREMMCILVPALFWQEKSAIGTVLIGVCLHGQ
jgi:hypothetical protein